MIYHTVIVGGGAWGTSAAMNLSKRGKKVLVLERGYLAYAQSGHTSAIIRQFYSHEETARIATLSLKYFEMFKDNTGFDAHFKQTGLLVASQDEGSVKNTVNVLHKVGARCDLLDKEEVRKLEADINLLDNEVYAFEPDAGYVDPVAVVWGYAECAKNHGAHVLEGVNAKRINRKENWVVDTDKGAFEAENIIVAAGTNTARLVHGTGISLPIYLFPFPMCYFRRPSDAKSLGRVVFDATNNYYARPDGENDLLVGPMHEEMTYAESSALAVDEALRWPNRDPDWTGRVDYDVYSAYLKALSTRFPQLAKARPSRDFVPLLDVTPDWQPIIDRLPGHDGLYVACGSSGHGFKLSPLVGQILADLVVDGKPPSIAAAYTLSRFKV